MRRFEPAFHTVCPQGKRGAAGLRSCEACRWLGARRALPQAPDWRVAKYLELPGG